MLSVYKTQLEHPLYGLVLTGGKRERMKRDKALIAYHAAPHAQFLHQLLKKYCSKVYLSARDGQWRGTTLDLLPTIPDLIESQGPIGGIVSAFATHPKANWFVVACDLPFFNDEATQKLLLNFEEKRVATCYRNAEKGFPEALCAIYSSIAGPLLRAALAEGNHSPVTFLKNVGCKTIEQNGSINLANVNSIEALVKIQNKAR